VYMSKKLEGIWRIWAPPPNLQEIPVAGHSVPFYPGCVPIAYALKTEI